MTAAPPTLTVFEHSPDGGRGLARDIPIRWALEEVGQAHDVRPLSCAAMKRPAHLALHPFGQIPALEAGDLSLFETGAIILHIARHYDRGYRLLPSGRNARAYASAWIFVALNKVEPPIIERETALYHERNEPWFRPRLKMIEDRIRARLDAFATGLGDEDWLEDRFSAGDLMVADVLRKLDGSALLAEYPRLAACVTRAEARPTLRRAFDAQHASSAPPERGERTRSQRPFRQQERSEGMEPMIYLFFKGNCFEAMTRYAEVLGGEITSIFRNADAPDPESCMQGGDDMVLNMTMTIGHTMIMASDNSDEMYETPRGFRVSIAPETREEFDSVHTALAEEARSVEMEPTETFWAERFSMFTDRYGTPWLLNCQGSKREEALT